MSAQTTTEYTQHSLGDKVKNLFHHKTDNQTEGQGDRSDPNVVHQEIRSARAEHELKEAEADAQIHDREVKEYEAVADDPNALPGQQPGGFVAPTIVGGRQPLEQAAHGHQTANSTRVAPGQPDLQGGTHIPESQLHARHHESQRTALRPSAPNDPTAMDGAPSKSLSAGDDTVL